MAQFTLYTYQFAPHINLKSNQMNLFGEVSLPALQIQRQGVESDAWVESI
jgi:hypothetical protein